MSKFESVKLEIVKLLQEAPKNRIYQPQLKQTLTGRHYHVKRHYQVAINSLKAKGVVKLVQAGKGKHVVLVEDGE